MLIYQFKFDGFVKSPILPFFWIPAYAGMTIKQLISSRYNIRHTREGGYPGVKMTFYEFIKFWIGGIALLFPIIKWIEYLKSKIRIPNSKIYRLFIIDTKSCPKRNEIMKIAINLRFCLDFLGKASIIPDCA